MGKIEEIEEMMECPGCGREIAYEQSWKSSVDTKIDLCGQCMDAEDNLLAVETNLRAARAVQDILSHRINALEMLIWASPGMVLRSALAAKAEPNPLVRPEFASALPPPLHTAVIYSGNCEVCRKSFHVVDTTKERALAVLRDVLQITVVRQPQGGEPMRFLCRSYACVNAYNEQIFDGFSPV